MKKNIKHEATEEHRLEVASEKRSHDEGIAREVLEEARVKALVVLKERQKFLDDLLNTLHAEAVNSIGDLEIKLAKANKDVLEEEAKVK